jgi:outer membrane immunogenic protein
MLKRVVIAAVAALGISVSAQAADMPIKGPVYKAQPAVFNWTGFYAGVHVGYGWGDADLDGGPAQPDGILGGLQLGYNWQARGSRWVLGLETDIAATDITGTDTLLGVATTKLDYFGTIRGRVGYTFDRMLVYGTAGFAYGHNKVTQVVAVPPTDRQFHTGWAAGAGVEWMFARNWSAKVEYLFVDLGTEFYNVGLGGNVILDFSTVRFGVNYRW